MRAERVAARVVRAEEAWAFALDLTNTRVHSMDRANTVRTHTGQRHSADKTQRDGYTRTSTRVHGPRPRAN